MTILCPHSRFSLKGFFSLLVFCLLLGGGLYIFSYNVFVGNRHAVADLEKRIVAAEFQNADLKKEEYELLDPSNLEAAAHSEGLLLEQKPEYLTVSLSQ